MNGYPNEYASATVETVEEYLREQKGHGTVIRTPPGVEETGFLCEIAAENRRFFLRICAEPKLGFLRCDLYPAQPPKTGRANDLAGWCAEMTGRWRIGSLQADLSRGTMFAHVETSFRDGPIGWSTLACLEQILLNMLLEALAMREEL